MTHSTHQRFTQTTLRGRDAYHHHFKSYGLIISNSGLTRHPSFVSTFSLRKVFEQSQYERDPTCRYYYPSPYFHPSFISLFGTWSLGGWVFVVPNGPLTYLNLTLLSRGCHMCFSMETMKRRTIARGSPRLATSTVRHSRSNMPLSTA